MKVALGKLWYSVLMDGAVWLKRAEMLGLKGGGATAYNFCRWRGGYQLEKTTIKSVFSKLQ